MGSKDSGHPDFPKSGSQTYKFDKDLDAQVRASQGNFGLESELGIVREGTFKARRDAQIKNRKKKGM